MIRSRTLPLSFCTALVIGCLLAQPAMAQKGKKPPSLGLTVTLNTSSIEAGGNVLGTVAHNNTDASAWVSVMLTSSDTQAATVEPTTLTIPAGATSANFDVAALAVSQSVSVTATSNGYSSGSATLAITAPSAPVTYRTIWLGSLEGAGNTWAIAVSDAGRCHWEV